MFGKQGMRAGGHWLVLFLLGGGVQLTSAVPASGQPCWLAAPDRVACYAGGSGGGGGGTGKSVVPAQRLSAVWGTLGDGRIVATLQHSEKPDPDGLENHSHDAAGPLVLLDQAGGVAETLVTTEVLRAFLSPAGDAVAAVTPERELLIWRSGSVLSVAAPGKVSHVGWSPDGNRLAAAVYPPEFSPHAMDNPGSVENFLRLQDSNLYLIDAGSGRVLTQLTTDPGTDYNPFFSPDGKSLYYIWLDAREDAGGLMRLALDRDNGTSASAAPVALTRAGEDKGEVPLGRVGTYLFTAAGQSLVFEHGLPDGSGETWAMRSDGSSAAFVAKGRKPSLMPDGAVAILTPAATIQILTPREVTR